MEQGLEEEFIFVTVEDNWVDAQNQWDILVRMIEKCEKFNIFAIAKDWQNHAPYKCSSSIN
jgi:hypothetical protein